MSDPARIDKDLLYGDFRAAEKRRQDLAMRAAHKALDLADDPMHIEANRTTNGVGAKGLVGAALAAGLPTAGLAGLLLMRQPQAAPPARDEPPVTMVLPAAPAPQPKAAPPAKRQEYDAITEEQQPDGSWRQIRRERLKPGGP